MHRGGPSPALDFFPDAFHNVVYPEIFRGCIAVENQFSRSELLFGPEAMERLSRAHVAVFGLGGVGGYAVEALTRSGVGALDLIDHDRFGITNLNRQLHATHRSLGEYKADAAQARILDINPQAKVRTYKVFCSPETAAQFDFTQYDYVVDAIDTVTGKLALIQQAHDAGTPIISSMGAGNKLDPAALEVADIYETSVCPLARVMRRELKKRGIPALKVVYSREIPLTPRADAAGEGAPEPSRKPVPGSTAFVPAAAGLILASVVVRSIAFPAGR